MTLCDFTSCAQPAARPGLGWTQCSGLAEMLSAHSVAAVSPGTWKSNPSCSQAIGYCLELHLHTAQSRVWAGRGWTHLQIHSNPAKSCSTHCFEICTVLQGVKDLLRVSLHLTDIQDRGFDVLVKEYAVIVQQHLKCPALCLHLKWKAFTAHCSGVQTGWISEHTITFFYEEKYNAHSKVRQ